MRALALSGGKDSMACLHLMRDTLDCAIYIDTGYAYPETLAMIDYARRMLEVHRVRSQRPMAIPSDVVPADWTVDGQAYTTAKPVTITSYHECCYTSLAMPLMNAAKVLGVTELVCGQRNDESHKATSRDGDMVGGIKRLHPIEDWSELQVLTYLEAKMAVPPHFYAVKHSSLDCYDCTGYRKQSADRVTWTHARHPEFHAEYLARKTALDGAIKEAMSDG